MVAIRTPSLEETYHNFTIFQIKDDLLNLFAEAAYGRGMNGGLWEGKRTLVLIHAFRQATIDECIRLEAKLRHECENRSSEEVARMRELINP
jgi:geranylgeranyl diphosphate synthase type II